MARYTNYDDLLKKWNDLGLNEISKIHKVNAFNHFIKNLPTADVIEVKYGEWRHEYLECSVCKRNISEIYDADSSIQESSSVEPHIWIGVHKPEIKIVYKDRDKLIGIDKVEKDSPECNESGWCTIHLPKEVLNDSRMYLNRKQAKKLNFFAKYGYLKDVD